MKGLAIFERISTIAAYNCFTKNNDHQYFYLSKTKNAKIKNEIKQNYLYVKRNILHFWSKYLYAQSISGDVLFKTYKLVL